MTARPPAGSRWGFYCLANDAVLGWVLPMLESLRRFAPGMPLLFVPFDGRVGELERVARRFGHGLLGGEDADAFEAVGRRFYPDSEFDARGFRKLAAYTGPFERFVLLDSDVLLLGPLDDLLAGCEAESVDLLYFDTDLDQVYRPGDWRAARAARGARGFNAGVVASRRGLLDPASLAATLGGLPSPWQGVLVPNAEQPFLNYAAEEGGWRLAGAHELAADTCSTSWPACGRIEPSPDGYRLRGSGRWDEGWRLRFAHWAGIRLGPEMPNRELHEEFARAAAARLARGEG